MLTQLMLCSRRCFDRGVVVVHGVQRALPAQALLRRGHNVHSQLLRPGVRPRPTHLPLPLPLSPRLATIAPAAPGSRGVGRARVLVLKPRPSPPAPSPTPSPAPLGTVVGRVGGAGDGKPVVGSLHGHGPLAPRLVVRLDVTKIDLAVRLVRRAPLGSLPGSGRGSSAGVGFGVGVGVGGGGEAVVAVTGSEGRQAVSRASRRSVWGGVGSGGGSDLSAGPRRATALSLDPPCPPGAVSSLPPRGLPPVFRPALLASLLVIRDRETAERVQTSQRHVERSGAEIAVTVAGEALSRQ